jgi:NAD(P)-dependent dehydrogenase (short-subunit alcohol dehydrogenase family)
LLLTRALLPRLRSGAKVALVSSRTGSIGDNGSGGYYGYRMSKAALNAAGVSLAHDIARAVPYALTGSRSPRSQSALHRHPAEQPEKSWR